LWHRRGGRNKAAFVELHFSPHSAILPRDGAGSASQSSAPPQSLAELVRDKVPALAPTAKFDGVWWLPSAHAHTVYGALADFSHVDPVVYERRVPSRAWIVAVDVSPPRAQAPTARGERVLLVAHGLTGGSHEAYVRAVLARAVPPRGLGTRAVVLNFRGCNGSPVVTPRLYHAGSSDDIRHVVLWISHTFPECRMYGLGFSLGANILAKYAGEEGDACPLHGLALLANPWDFVKGSEHMLRTCAGRHLYRYVLGGALQRLLRVHRRAFLAAPPAALPLAHAQLDAVLRRRRLALGEWDELVTAPLFGFRHARDYYAKISSARFVRAVRVPCLAINSVDDPITGADGLPVREAAESPWLVLALTKTGGHLGWYEHGPDGKIGRWYVKPVVQFLAALMEYGLRPKTNPEGVADDAGFVRQRGRDDVGFRMLSPEEEAAVVVSGVHESKLFTGW
ncbi:AB-hydrolase YheT, partial [Trametes elegans]